jgi:hypothetical protein
MDQLIYHFDPKGVSNARGFGFDGCLIITSKIGGFDIPDE